jgi:TonB dependent receptor
MTHSPGFTGAKRPDGFSNSFLPKVTNSTSYNFAGTATKILTKHTLKFGGEHRRYYDNFLNAGGANIMNFMVDPLYRFQGDWGLGATEGRILGMGSFLLGINDRNNIAKPVTRAMNTNYHGLFFQDDWKVTPKLTLNLGVRWDDERPTTERHDKLYFWDPTYPSLFKINPGYNFQAELAKAKLPADSPVPSWVTQGGFDPGAVLIANAPQFKSRSPQLVSNTQFAPRVGLAYQASKATVIRASGGKMYLPTTGNPNSYATSNSNVALSDQAFAGWHASTDGGRTYISTWENPFPLAAFFTNYTRDVLTANLQSSLDPGASVVSRELHMPREYNWAVDVQRQLPSRFLIQIGYAGNRGLGLLATDTISHYPKDLLVPKYAASMQQFMLSPNAGQTLETTITGTTQQLGLLEYQYPYYGRVQVSGINEGRSSYHAMTVRLERRFYQGLSVGLNYTYSRLLDDVGGADGQGGKTVQSVDSYRAAWGLSPLDRSHNLNIAYTYEFPFGKGRHFLGSPSGVTATILDRVVGGWQLAGNYFYTSGTPITLTGSTTSNINNTIKVNQSWGSYASSDHNLTPVNYQSDSQVLYSAVDPITASSIRRLDPTKVVGAQAFISGNLPPNDGAYRNPGLYQMDISLMKNFRWTEARYFQFRAEAQNVFNIRGFGPYNSSIGTPNYGLITTAGNQSRQIQFSARINF